MKKLTILTTLLLAISSFAVADESNVTLEGYGKTKWSMTENEAMQAESPRIQKLTPPKEFPTGTALLSINNIEIASHKFDALFIFNKPEIKLTQVNLTSQEQKNALINADTFESIEKLLTQKYGAPTFKNENKEISWQLPETIIQLTHVFIPGIMSKVVISYKPSSDSIQAAKDL